MASWGHWKILVRVYVTDEMFVVFGPVWFVCVFHNVELSALGFVAFFQLCQTHSVALSLSESVWRPSLIRSSAEGRFSFRARAWVQAQKHHLGSKRGALLMKSGTQTDRQTAQGLSFKVGESRMGC